MTSTVRNCRPAAGFTLLEIVIALLIAAMVMAGAVGLVTVSSDEYALKKATRELEGMSKRARMTAVLRQAPQALVFRDGRIEMMSWALALEEEGFAEMSEEDAAKQGERRQLVLADGIEARVRRWNSDEWLGTRGGAVHAWRFDPSGLCEPLGVRLILDESTMEMVFHPLTGAIDNYSLDIR